MHGTTARRENHDACHGRPLSSHPSASWTVTWMGSTTGISLGASSVDTMDPADTSPWLRGRTQQFSRKTRDLMYGYNGLVQFVSVLHDVTGCGKIRHKTKMSRVSRRLTEPKKKERFNCPGTTARWSYSRFCSTSPHHASSTSSVIQLTHFQGVCAFPYAWRMASPFEQPSSPA